MLYSFRLSISPESALSARNLRRRRRISEDRNVWLWRIRSTSRELVSSTASMALFVSSKQKITTNAAPPQTLPHPSVSLSHDGAELAVSRPGPFAATVVHPERLPSVCICRLSINDLAGCHTGI